MNDQEKAAKEVSDLIGKAVLTIMQGNKGKLPGVRVNVRAIEMTNMAVNLHNGEPIRRDRPTVFVDIESAGKHIYGKGYQVI